MSIEVRPLKLTEKDLLRSVIDLGRRNSATLGFFPDGAFEEHAYRETILIALSSGSFAGYVLYRLSNDRVSLTHLCVHEDFRGKGVTKLLVKAVRLRTEQYEGMGFKCRNDYGIGEMWKKLGFYPRGEVVGRGKSQNPLTQWYMDYGKADLFTVASTNLTTVVLDANVLFNLSNGVNIESAQCLVADWLVDEIDLAYTGEIFNEIERIEDLEKRKVQRSRLNAYISTAKVCR